MRIRPFVPIFAALLAPLSAAHPQYQTRTWLDWRTIETARFSFHFPSELEPWARTVAGKMDAIDTAVSRVVGFQGSRRIQVVLDDPFRIPNGSAWPFIDAPALVLWAAPPNPREDIGTYVSWGDMIATHEFAHLAHLLRPSRNGLQSLLWKLAPVELGPISRKSPRWMIEGYATYVEGLITKSGRPNGMWRSTILRQWAIEGVLPTYGQLDAMGGMYGGEFAYLAGSSFIEWLVARRGDSSLVDLWRRLSARRDRGFAEAFTGVYGEPPDILYGRFTAQLTADAMAMRASVRRSDGDSGTTIQHLARETGDPAISADGGRVALVLASTMRPGRVVIWSTLPEPDTVAARAARAQIAHDPADVPAYRPFPPAKKALATLHAIGNQSFQDPRFFRDGRVLVWRNSAVGDGSWTPDLYVWDPQRNSVERLTHRANLRQGDPAPDGSMIVATRCSAGHCDLVGVDLRAATVSVLAEGSDTRSFYRPRFSPDGRRIVVGVRSEGFWRTGIVNATDRSLRLITTGRTNYFDASFVDDSTLVATSDASGIPNIVSLRLDGTAIGVISNETGAAVAPEVNPADGSVWFLSLHARGWDLRSVRGDGSAITATPSTITDRPAPAELRSIAVKGPIRYSPRRKWIYFPGGNFIRNGGNLSLGLANTDPVGKHELIVQLAKAVGTQNTNAAWEGASASLTSRSRVAWTASAFELTQNQSSWRSVRGAALSGEFAHRVESYSLRAMAGGTGGHARADILDPDDRSRLLAFAELSASATRFRNGRRTAGFLSVSTAQGRLATSSIGRTVITAGVTSTEVSFSLFATAGYATTDAMSEQFSIGGYPPTMVQPGVLSQFIVMPALPPVFYGERLETYRLAVPLGGAQFYTWLGRAWNQGPAPQLERVYGVELTRSIAQIAPLGTPGARVTIGIGRWDNRRVVAVPLIGPVPPTGGPIRFYLTTQFGDWAR